MNKEETRKSILLVRQALSAREVGLKSEKICKACLGLPEVKDKKNVSLYLPIENEVKTGMLFEEFLKRKAMIAVPYYLAHDDRYYFSRFLSFENLEKGPFGILQPKDLDVVEPMEIDVAFMPGVAFSKEGVRLGFGKGVFDRLLFETKAIKIGLAYEFQIVDDLPKEEHDLVVDLVVTEERVISNKLINC